MTPFHRDGREKGNKDGHVLLSLHGRGISRANENHRTSREQSLIQHCKEKKVFKRLSLAAPLAEAESELSPINLGSITWTPGIFEIKLKNHVEEEKSEAQFPEPLYGRVLHQGLFLASKLSVSSFLWNSGSASQS